ncbi:MAG: hypothetical protein AABZ31_01190 [Bdellovibrionota bacterium]
MPRNKNILVSTLGLLFAAFAIAHLSQWSTSEQGVQSYKHIRRTIKMMPPIEISISKLEEKSVEPGDIVTLVATINSSLTAGRVRWEWKAGNGVEFLDNQTSGYLEMNSAREQKTLQVRFRQVSNKNEMIHLNFYQGEERQQNAGSSVYNSLNQDLINLETAEIMERQKIYHEEMEDGITVLSSEAEDKNKAHKHEH